MQQGGDGVLIIFQEAVAEKENAITVSVMGALPRLGLL